MKKIVLLAGIICICFFERSAAQVKPMPEGVLNLKQCIDVALQNNVDVNRAGFTMENGKQDLTRSKGNMLPFVSGTINHGLSQGRAIDPFTNTYINQNLTSATYSADASVSLWSGGSIRNDIKASQYSYDADKMDLQQQKDNLTINVILAYLLVLNNQEQLNAAYQQADVTRKQVDRLTVMNNDGAIAPPTLYDTKGQLASDELSIISIKNALETAKISLAGLMNVTYDSTMQLEKIDINGDMQFYDGNAGDIYNQALQSLAYIKAAELRQQSADRTLKSVKGQLFPSLSLYGGLGTNYSSAASISSLVSTQDVATDSYVLSGTDKLTVYAPQSSYANSKINYGSQWKNNFNSFVGISLRIPILNGLQTHTQVKRSEVAVKRATFESNAAKTALQQTIQQAYTDMQTAFDRFQKLSGQVEDLGRSFRAAEAKFNAGVLTSVEYLIIKSNYDKANINLIAAKYDYVLRTRILDFYKGTLSL